MIIKIYLDDIDFSYLSTTNFTWSVLKGQTINLIENNGGYVMTVI
jgi:hypothetical protein